MWKNTLEQRQEVIAENNPPKFKHVGIKNREKYAEWIKQQPPLTEVELKALNDPILMGTGKESFCGLGELSSALWWIQKVRQANADVFPDKHFAWHENFEKQLNDPKSYDYKAVQALKKTGISLDRLFERVKKGRQIRKIKEQEKPQKDKEKILANIQDWEIRGEYIYNPKTGHYKSATHRDMWAGGDDKYPYYSEYDGVKLTPETYSEIRKVIFNNLLKNLREKIKFRKKNSEKVLEKNNYSPAEWTEIQKARGKNKFSTPDPALNKNVNNNYNTILLVVASLIILVLVGGLFLIKKRKKNGSKR